MDNGGNGCKQSMMSGNGDKERIMVGNGGKQSDDDGNGDKERIIVEMGVSSR